MPNPGHEANIDAAVPFSMCWAVYLGAHSIFYMDAAQNMSTVTLFFYFLCRWKSTKVAEALGTA